MIFPTGQQPIPRGDWSPHLTTTPAPLEVSAVRAANEVLRRDLYAQREVVAQLKSALQVKIAHVPENIIVEPKIVDQAKTLDEACEIVEPMDQVEERPPTPYTPSPTR
jgi:hypothetical protein